MSATDTEYLTIPEVADRLGMTADGAYKLVQRGKLEAVRLSERKLRVTPEAFDRFVASIQRDASEYLGDDPAEIAEVLRHDFIAEVGPTPEEWLAAWKRDEIEETPESLQILVRATVARAAALNAAPEAQITARRTTTAR